VWQQLRSADLAMCVNVSTHQLMSAGFVGTVADVLGGGSADPALLTLEVNESVFVRDEKRAKVVLSELRDLGVKLSLDDFGTGFSSLSYLNALPIDSIKIDRTFIAELEDADGTQTIVNAIIQLAHGLGRTVISEGVETLGQHDELTRLGSDSCQGFYFAKPMPATSLGQLLERQAGISDPRLPAIAAASDT
jgi:EAL domain-containing protein (putative c-di-GMP-specific phosphodiesterase class I)